MHALSINVFVGSKCTRQYTDIHWGSRLAALHLYCVGCVWNHHLQSYKTGSCVISSESVVGQCWSPSVIACIISSECVQLFSADHHMWSHVLSAVSVYSCWVLITICDHIRCVISSECDSYSNSVLICSFKTRLLQLTVLKVSSF